VIIKDQMQLFYTPDINSQLHILDKEESWHCMRVLRLKKGDIIFLTNGKGTLFEARIIEPDPKKCIVEVIGKQEEYGKRSYCLHLAVAPTKNIDRFEWFMEKATEIGIDEITPVICEHSERKQIRTDRLNKVITAAVKQSLKAYHPKLNDAVTLKKFIETNSVKSSYIAHLEETNPKLLKDLYEKGSDAVILVGPEGDFSPGEMALAKENGFCAISLGDYRLRTETAAVVACHTIALLNQL
jgi:16S rRNA (uracil1498-N3)-methyltransferase